MKQWYVVYTKPRQEQLARENLERQGFETFLPWCQRDRRRRTGWVMATEPLFPRYLFLRVDLARDNTASVRSTTGAVGFVVFGGRPRHVPDLFVGQLAALAAPDSRVVPIGPERFRRGDPVEVKTGPFAGLEGIFLEDKGADRVMLLFRILGRENAVAVARNNVALAG
jgi:transcriptional antiterminator RfaH